MKKRGLKKKNVETKKREHSALQKKEYIIKFEKRKSKKKKRELQRRGRKEKGENVKPLEKKTKRTHPYRTEPAPGFSLTSSIVAERGGKEGEVSFAAIDAASKRKKKPLHIA